MLYEIVDKLPSITLTLQLELQREVDNAFVGKLPSTSSSSGVPTTSLTLIKWSNGLLSTISI